jgi:hypothetical protein
MLFDWRCLALLNGNLAPLFPRRFPGVPAPMMIAVYPLILFAIAANGTSGYVGIFFHYSPFKAARFLLVKLRDKTRRRYRYYAHHGRSTARRLHLRDFRRDRYPHNPATHVSMLPVPRAASPVLPSRLVLDARGSSAPVPAADTVQLGNQTWRCGILHTSCISVASLSLRARRGWGGKRTIFHPVCYYPAVVAVVPTASFAVGLPFGVYSTPLRTLH